MNEVVYIPEAKMLRLFIVLDMISERGRTVNFIAQCCDMQPRMVYRYLHVLNTIGFEIVKTGSHYKLGQGRPKFIDAYIK